MSEKTHFEDMIKYVTYVHTKCIHSGIDISLLPHFGELLYSSNNKNFRAELETILLNAVSLQR